MNWNVIGKYAAGAAILGSIYALVFMSKVDPQVYVGMAGTVLAALGIVAANSNKPS